MAKTKLSKAKMVKWGYGQVEPNHLSAKRTGQIYAQLPAKNDITVLENGMFAKYHYSAGVVDFDTSADSGEWMLVYNEVKLYEDRQTEADFAMIADNYNAYVYNAAGDLMKGVTRQSEPSYGYDLTNATKMVPRLLKTNVGDIFTTNTINEDSVSVADKLYIGDDGYLTKTQGTDTNSPIWTVVKVYTMPDGQPAAKVQRIA